MDPFEAALLNLGGVVGMLAGLYWMLATGRLMTRREGDALTKRAESAEKSRDEVITQNTELMEMAKLGKSVFTALEKGAIER